MNVTNWNFAVIRYQSTQKADQIFPQKKSYQTRNSYQLIN